MTWSAFPKYNAQRYNVCINCVVLVFCLNACTFIRGIRIFRQEGRRGKQDFVRCSDSFWRKSHEVKRAKLLVMYLWVLYSIYLSARASY